MSSNKKLSEHFEHAIINTFFNISGGGSIILYNINYF